MIEVKAEAEGDCPECKKHIKLPTIVEFEMPKENISKAQNVTITEKLPQIQTIQHENHSHAAPANDPHIELAKSLPKGWNFATCKDGNCGTIVRNPNGLETSFKTCPNCGDNTNRKAAKICKTCGKKPDSKDEWNESEVKIETEDEDNE